MNRVQVARALRDIKKGAYFNIEYQKVIKKVAGYDIVRTTKIVARYGISYTHMKCVGKSEGTTKLPEWLEWDDKKSYLLHYIGKDKSKKDNLYLRVSLSKSPKHIPKSEYTVDGKILDDSVHPGLLKKLNEMDSRSHPDSVMHINIDNITKIGK